MNWKSLRSCLPWPLKKKERNREMGELKVTGIEDLQRIGHGEVVELPGFVDGTPFVARLRRPSMLAMVKAGKIPNELLVEANKLFASGVKGVAEKNQDDPSMMSDLTVLLDAICREAFIEPSWEDIEKSGVTLTDQQYLAVFSYTQKGVDVLKPFRQVGGGSKAGGNAGNAKGRSKAVRSTAITK